MSRPIRIAMAQLNTLVGDIPGNTQRLIAAAEEARDRLKADLILFPELALCGYPPEDLLLRSSMLGRVAQGLEQLKAVSGIHMVIGLPGEQEGRLYNQAVVLRDGEVLGRYSKQHLPNYQVFDEKRYFVEGRETLVVDCLGTPMAITVCEDVWHPQPVAQARELGAKLILTINASPFHLDKLQQRHQVVAQRCAESELPLVYINQVGGQDELVFDGASFAMNADGVLAASAPAYEEGIFLVEFDPAAGRLLPGDCAAPLDRNASAYQALVCGVRDYVTKNGFRGVVLGLSGGIDSALTLAVAVDALGAERVEAVMMPFRYTSQMSLEDAEEEANTLGVRYSVLPIEPMFDAFMATLAPQFEGTGRDTTEENLQARCRGVLLMALSNKKGYLVLTTGNKSEMAVGYATLYGDMAGGFDVLKDVPKSMVFALSNYRNSLSPAIPQRVIDRPPSAELAPDQVDEDSLPPYDVLDPMLELYIEQDQSAEAIIAQGFERESVYRVLRMVDINEYKRRQAAIGVRITSRGFGRDRRYPVTSGWKQGD
ncbi:NAD+ synthase [Aestuariirhabdus litorea]|uniref:Glutamine-dependent NAD(+) synthetase n=1 Tax=Aestuariirhabdus litorea TaxID=2528527 RepID=A0A3P3VR09_9GAMM|nr:NAD+ synthase [Aestuariirhabdus litorea]RRJ83263.1 NAD+ synthase [Aestuariirhabdus litorea]RWW93422.1 NAD+ synthase [Endozoicomonadaceae bacterium GTF-13]